MNTVTLSPLQKQLFQVQPQHSHPRLSLTRVLWVRFLRWLDKASSQAILKILRRAGTLLLVYAAVFNTQFLLGFLLAATKFNGFRIPAFLGLLYVTLNARPLWRRLRHPQQTKSANQHTYHGIPVSEFASFLVEHRSFKHDEAIKTLGLSEGGWKKIAEELEQRGVLFKDHQQKNARVLRPISRENLVRQLRDKFPLMWDDEREIWVDRDGPFNRWVLSQEFTRRKLEEKTERKERKLERLQDKIEQTRMHPIFTGGIA